MLTVTIENRLPEELTEIIHCLSFWNKNGIRVYNENRAGTLGTQKSQEQARIENFELWMLRNIECDIKNVCHNKDGYIFGLSGSHVWLSYKESKERILMIKNG